ncbi:TPA: 2Fe-2S iron-sulfur cluster-binding protein [Pseudomonas aeruginosa]|uniref:2Fe-2S iron-sulfur cluster-binding protein n=1 Tax=Pseudomonas TaxID=286 RepID=UPI0003B9B891|nr:2Fe-2S iron-sulfur cluster-binding protein [Pseudomonas aeruginosa]EKU2896491.1 (2Fe-2S)-binding protein [Pseudomonas aeruginosa]EKX9245241.1 (2Fe-2S)-binding protein [Pseudomonas aeruginosa]ERV49669.1 terpredoxin [Pseudomonas aeruginosa BL14]MBV5721428.1 (2Fe-2S)-binding protein [Pseudomonas aeruginosa]MDG3721656.1 (2Fe-2S)-binding protein [Pseudomonas aeruginosa]
MPRVVFIDDQSGEYAVDAQDGQSLMEVATQNGVPGIVAECGGSCVCATCRIEIEEAWVKIVGEANPDENDLLQSTGEPMTTGTRLSCQVFIDPSMDGLIVKVPLPA